MSDYFFVENFLGDFKVCINQRNSVDPNKLRSILNHFGLKNRLGYILDLVIDCAENFMIGSVYVEFHNTISDYIVVNF